MLGQTVVAARYEERMHKAVRGEHDTVHVVGRVAQHGFEWRCRHVACQEHGEGNVSRCTCCGRPVKVSVVTLH